jgi:two-component system, sensor histidine kinase LadS
MAGGKPASLLQNRPMRAVLTFAKRAFTAAARCALLLALAGAVLPALAQSPVLELGSEASAPSLDAAMVTLLDSTGTLNVDQVEQVPPERFVPARRGHPHQIEGGTLWLRFDALARDPAVTWRLTVPLPGVDDVSLHYRNAAGQWVHQRAGDSLRMSSWPQPGRYPVFTLSRDSGTPVRYFVEIHHARVPFSALPRVVSDTSLIVTRQEEHLLLGIYFGLAALVIALALANAVAYRDRGFASYAVYMLLFAGAQGAFTGVAGLYWWPELPVLNNIGAFGLPVAAAAAALWFVRTITAPRRFSRALDWLILAFMVLLPLVSVLDAVFPTVESFSVINALITGCLLVLLIVLGVALFEGDRHARWIALGFLPVLLATLFPLMRNFGVIPSGFLTDNGTMLASAIEAPILFYGLLRRVSQRRQPNSRASALRTNDPLTGVHAIPVLVDKLRQALGTAERYPQPFALLVIDLINLAGLQSQHGRETGDRALVMAAARIRAVARPADTVARVGDSLFALLLEGPVNAQEANNIATKILASGLRPSRQLPDGEPLQFHIAVGHLGEPSGVAPTEAAACLTRMVQAALDLNDGTAKAIRLVKL